MPFQDKLTDVDEITTSSSTSQIVFSTLYILSFISLLPKRHIFYQIIKTEKFFTLFLIWSFITVFWSDVPLVSFKRWLRIFGNTLIMISALLYLRKTDDATKFFKIILSIYLPLSFLSILFIPGAIQYNQSAWRGIAAHKNTLGQISLVSVIIWSYALQEESIKKKLFAFIFLSMSLVLLMGSRSVTAYLTASALLALAGFLYVDKKIFRPTIGRFFSSMFIFSFIVCMIPAILLSVNYLASLVELFGKDLTFSGRTYLWADVFDDAKTHLFYGCGFGGYWVPGTPAMERIWEIHYTLFNQAHLGYLDLLNETGIIGILLFVCIVIFYFINLIKLGQPHFWKVFIISALISNLQESSLFKPLNLTGALFIFSYLILYIDRVKSKFEILDTAH